MELPGVRPVPARSAPGTPLLLCLKQSLPEEKKKKSPLFLG